MGDRSQTMRATAARLTFALTLAVGVAPPAAPQSAPALASRIVAIDGRAMRAQVAGLEGRRAGAPIVVFESGALQFSDNWGRILGAVAVDAPVVAYDRAGLGQSEWDNQTPTPAHVTQRLRRLLQQLGASPPYLLVGYSWGGSLARYFAGYYPGDVAGIVYIDPGPIVTQSIDDELAPYRAIGAGQTGYDAFWSAYAGFIERMSPAARAEFTVYRDLMRVEPAARDLRPPPDVPTAMLIAAKQQPLPLQLPFDAAAHFQADVRHRISRLQEWALASSQATIVVSNQTTHAVLREDPDLVIWAIKRVLANIAAKR